VLYPSAFCPQIIKHSHTKIHTEFHKNKKEICQFLFFGEMAKPIFPPNFNWTTRTHRAQDRWCVLSVVLRGKCKAPKRQTRIFPGFQSSDTQPP